MLGNKIGIWGEEKAKNYLLKSGFKILELNYAIFSGKQLGEIDIIAEKNSSIYFVEVKTRSCADLKQSLPEEAISRKKLQNISRVAQFYIKKSRKEAYQQHFSCITISYNKLSGESELRFFNDIFF